MNWQNNENQTNGINEDLALTEAVTGTVKGGGGTGRDILIGGLSADELKSSLGDLPLTSAQQVRGGVDGLLIHNTGALRNVAGNNI